MEIKRIPFLAFLLMVVHWSIPCWSQAQPYLSPESDGFRLAQRLALRDTGLTGEVFHTAIRPYDWNQILTLIDSVPFSGDLEAQDALGFRRQAFLLRHSVKNCIPSHKPSWLYAYPAALYSVITPSFKLSINPVINVNTGPQWGKDHGNTFQNTLYNNTRGAEVWSLIDQKVSVFILATDNQMRAPLQTRALQDSNYVLPGEGYYKSFKGNGLDFFHAEGAVSVPVTTHIGMQFGNTRQFIGDGMRSLILSDFSRPRLNLRINTRVWKLQYQNLFYELIDSPYITGGSAYLKKYGATHYLSIALNKRVQLGLFESVIFQRSNQGYELNYLNPVIFYRAIEHSLGSPDNVILGLNFSAKLNTHAKLYGQLVFDEFVLKEMQRQFFKPHSDAHWGWWGNKYATQLGLQTFDLGGISSLDAQLEWNQVRPYTYAYSNPALSYTDFNQSLAHPLGANLKELMLKLSYRPIKALSCQLKTFVAYSGLDTSADVSYGSNILLSTKLKQATYQQSTTQGLHATLWWTELALCWRLPHEIFLDLSVTSRKKITSLQAYNSQNTYVMLGIRVNASRRDLSY